MGYQQSLVKFNNLENLKEECKIYQARDTKDDMAGVYGVVKTVEAIHPFEIGELALIVGGERYEQRGVDRIEEAIGLKNVHSVVFIDNAEYWHLSNGDIGKLLDKHFKQLVEDEMKELDLI